MYHLLWIFFIYAFLGWCTEVSYAALKTGRFVNRGFLNGPVCPVYGFGVVIVLWVLEPLRGNLLLLFLGSVALTSLLEWLTGFVLERLFHQRWWDYSQEPALLHCLGAGLPVCGQAAASLCLVVHPNGPLSHGSGAAGSLFRGHGGGSGRHGVHHCPYEPAAEPAG